ncbi:MAG: dynamin family protein [Firmicutes bacterium]|nr:dynamin family protein [Bacillota bacterium]
MSINYAEARSEILMTLGELKASLNHDESLGNSNMLEYAVEKLTDNKFNLVVMGEFKRGKTSFINALLGEAVLPMAVVPLTSIITELVYGDNPSAEVIFENGQRKTISLEMLDDYVTERNNPNNEKGVKKVVVKYPSEYLREGVILVDTPGVGSIYEHNTEVSYDYLPEADAVIFLVSSDPPISKTEIAYLGDIKEYIEKIFFVQNKIDYLSESEREESLAFSRKVLEQALGGRVTLIPLSARLALQARQNGNSEMLIQSNLPEFEHELSEFLLKEKGLLILTVAVNRGLQVTNNVLRHIELELKSLEAPIEIVEKQLADFKKYVEQIERKRLDAHYLMKGQLGELIKQYDEDTENLKKEKLPEAIKELEEAFEKVKAGPKAQISDALDDAVKSIILSIFTRWRSEQEKKVSAGFEAVAKRLIDETNGIAQEIVDKASDIFGLSLSQIVGTVALLDSKWFYYMSKEASTSIELLAAPVKSMLPKAFAAKIMYADAKEKLIRYFDMHCGRIRGDLYTRLDDSLLALKGMLDERVADMISSIESAVTRGLEYRQRNEVEIQKRKLELEAYRERIEKIELELTSYANEIG